jgi:hypothetical protein
MGTFLMATANTKDLSLLGPVTTSVTNAGADVSTTEWRTPNLDLISGQSYRLYNQDNSSGMVYTAFNMPSDLPTVYFRVAFKIDKASSSEITIVELYEGAGTTLHGKITLVPGSGILRAYRSTITLATSATGAVSQQNWNVMEVMFTPADSGGRFVIKVNGITVIDYTGDTRNSGTAGRTGQVRIGIITTLGTYANMYLDDIVFSDDAWPGTGGLWVLPVTGNGDLQEWTASEGAQHECISALPGDFSKFIYASGAVAGVDSNFEFANLPLTPTAIGAVMLVAQARAAAPGSVPVRTIAYSGATVANGTTVGVDVGTVTLTQIMDTDPATSSAWSESAVNALKGGVGITTA